MTAAAVATAAITRNGAVAPATVAPIAAAEVDRFGAAAQKSLEQVLAPSIEMADGYPMEAQTAEGIERMKEEIRKWPESRKLFLVHEGEDREAPRPGEIFRQADLARTMRAMVVQPTSDRMMVIAK